MYEVTDESNGYHEFARLTIFSSTDRCVRLITVGIKIVKGAMDISTLLDPSHLVTFLGGTAVGAAGKYFADLFTDQRKKKEELRAERLKFARLKSLMPALLDEMKEDILENKGAHMREFVVLPSEVTLFNSGKPRFVYFETKHPAAQNQADTLLSEGHVDVVQLEGPRIYRLKEAFVEKLLNDA